MTLIERALQPLKQQVEAEGLPWEAPHILADEAPDFGEWIKADCRLGADVSSGKLCMWFICKEPLELPEPDFDPEHHLALYEQYVKWDYPVGLGPAGRHYIDMLRKLDALIKDGKGDGPEADELRDKMDPPWWEMTEQECDLVDAYVRGGG